MSALTRSNRPGAYGKLKNVRVLTTTTSNPIRVHCIVLPGILTDGVIRHHSPLSHLLEEVSSTVSYIQYVENPRYSHEGVVQEIADRVSRNVSRGVKTLLFGSSLGGIIAANVLKVVRQDSTNSPEAVERLVAAIIVDAPSDGADIVISPLPQSAAKFAALAFRTFTPHKRANAWYGAWMLGAFSQAPKDHEIETVEGGPSLEQIKRTAKQESQGHSFTAWWDQVGMMLHITQNTASGLEGLNVAYIACLEGNRSVKQPNTMEKWRPYVRRVLTIHTAHCTYLEMQPTWERLLRPALAELLAHDPVKS